MLNVRIIQMAVVRAYDITYMDLIGERRDVGISHPRMIAMWLCCELLPHKSLPQIGRVFRRHHTSILHGKKRGREITGHSQFHIEKVNLIIKALKERRENEASLAQRCDEATEKSQARESDCIARLSTEKLK